LKAGHAQVTQLPAPGIFLQNRSGCLRGIGFGKEKNSIPVVEHRVQLLLRIQSQSGRIRWVKLGMTFKRFAAKQQTEFPHLTHSKYGSLWVMRHMDS